MNNIDLNKSFNFKVDYNLNDIDLNGIIINPKDPSNNGLIDLLNILSKNNNENNIGFSLFKDDLENFNINCITYHDINTKNNEIKTINVYHDVPEIISETFGAGNKIGNKQSNNKNLSSKIASKDGKNHEKIQKTKRFTKSKRK
jgi:hypothetical protein